MKQELSVLDTKIVVHHVGARGLGVSFYPPKRFVPDLVNVLYEADTDSVERMNRDRDQFAESLGEVYILPHALGLTHGTAKLHLTHNAYASSLLPPDKSFPNYYCELHLEPAVYDIDYDDMLRIIRTVDVEVHALDELLAAHKLPHGAPDFLSVDTQGTELDILKGASQSIEQGVLGVVTEVEIVPMYKNQPLLGDLMAFMTEKGFYFAGFTILYDISPYRARIGLRGKGFPGFGDALFLRKIDNLAAAVGTQEMLFLKLAKLAFIAIAFGYLEHGLSALTAAHAMKPQIDSETIGHLTGRQYWRFLEQVQTVARSVPQVYPPRRGTPVADRPQGSTSKEPSWAELYHETAAHRFYAKYRGLTLAEGDVMPGSPRFLRWLYNRLVVEPATSNERLRHLVLRRPDKALAKFLWYMRQRNQPTPIVPPLAVEGQRPSVFEQLLIEHGFHDVASTVARRRVAAERFVSCLDLTMRVAGQCDAPDQRPDLHLTIFRNIS